MASMNIKIVKSVGEGSTLLSAFDIFLFPSRSEALGYAALEVGIARLPVIASAIGGIPEIIKDKDSGILVSVGDVDAFTQAIALLIKDPSLRERLGTSLHYRVIENFSQKQMLQKTLDLYGP